jgi:hypothetical protein
MADFLIHDSTPADVLFPASHARGLVPCDYARHPVGYLGVAPPMRAVDMPLVPRSEWSARIREMEATKSRLSDVRTTAANGQSMPSLDKSHWGYCWAHSTTHAVMMLRALANEPYVPLSAFAVACIIKDYRDEGGWGALSLEFAAARGIPSQALWPQQSVARSNDKPETWANAALHKVTEGWVDLDAAAYDRELTFDQVMTCLLCRVPVVGDFNWWWHSVCLLDPVEVEPGSFGVRILNSWSDSWGEKGLGVLQGAKAVPDGAVAPRVTTPAFA